MRIARHFRERYCQRIKGIHSISSARQYIAEHQAIIDVHIMRMFQYSTYLGRGHHEKGNSLTADFYRRGKIVLVHDPVKDSLVTLFFEDERRFWEVFRSVAEPDKIPC